MIQVMSCAHCHRVALKDELVASRGHHYHPACHKCYVCSNTDLQNPEVFKGVLFCDICAIRIFGPAHKPTKMLYKLSDNVLKKSSIELATLYNNSDKNITSASPPGIIKDFECSELQLAQYEFPSCPDIQQDVNSDLEEPTNGKFSATNTPAVFVADTHYDITSKLKTPSNHNKKTNATEKLQARLIKMAKYPFQIFKRNILSTSGVVKRFHRHDHNIHSSPPGVCESDSSEHVNFFSNQINYRLLLPPKPSEPC